MPQSRPRKATIITVGPRRRPSTRSSSCAIDHIPPPLLGQLAPNGVMVIPVGPPGAQHALRVTKRDDRRGNIEVSSIASDRPTVPSRCIALSQAPSRNPPASSSFAIAFDPPEMLTIGSEYAVGHQAGCPRKATIVEAGNIGKLESGPAPPLSKMDQLRGQFCCSWRCSGSGWRCNRSTFRRDGFRLGHLDWGETLRSRTSLRKCSCHSSVP